jgi:apolipoprotein N-acyltransferase
MQLNKPGRGFLFIAITHAVVNVFIWRGMIPVPTVMYLFIALIIDQLFVLPYLVNRLLSNRYNGVISTLIFPTAFTSAEYLGTLLFPKATWQILAYTQYHNLVLMQLASITGIWGISFLITWFASVINYLWQRDFEWAKIRKVTMIYACVLFAVMITGAARLIVRSKPNYVRTASVVDARNIDNNLSTCKWTDSKGIGAYSAEVEDNLLRQTNIAADAGAKIVLWQESAGFIPKKEEETFIKNVSALAANRKIYLLMTLWSVPEDFPHHLVENKSMLINPAGNVCLNYLKSNPVAPEPIVRGDGIVPMVETPYGKIATAICYDGDFQNFIRQAGKQKADILLLPGNDWKEIAPFHSYMAATRAIENGFAMVHPVGHGLSIATDNRGRLLSSMDFFSTNEQIMYADVPIDQSTTIYSQAGDFFAWLCLVGLGALIMKNVKFKMKKIGVESQRVPSL